jgi:predicted transposase/invertase (TIGR01784 family)
MNEQELLNFDPEGELAPNVAPPPLADPVFTKLFLNVEVGGLAMKELLNATLEDSGDVLIGDIISLKPQTIHPDTSSRAFRIDVEATTVKGEVAITEVQLNRFASMIERDLLYSEQAFAMPAKIGAKLKDVIFTMPRVVVLNILDFDLRKNGKNFHQVVDMAHREEPRERATDKFEIHNLELKKFRRIKPDLSKPLHCWLTAICKAQDQQISVKEVIEMDATLQEYYGSNPGFAQFTDRHAQVSADPEIRKDYRRWQYEQVINALERERTLAEGEARGEARGIAEGKAQGIAEGKAQGIAEGKAQGIAEGEARAKARSYMEALPMYFELIQLKPSLKGEIFAMGANAGVNEQTIQREYDQWAQAKLEKAMQPDSQGRTSVTATLEAGRLIQEAGKAEKRKTKRRERDER